jgi:hypothetical protein
MVNVPKLLKNKNNLFFGFLKIVNNGAVVLKLNIRIWHPYEVVPFSQRQ